MARRLQHSNLLLPLFLGLTLSFSGAARLDADEPASALPSGNFAGPVQIPGIARFYSLPMRMDLEPSMTYAGVQYHVDPRHMEVFHRVLQESEDSELLELAALSSLRLAGMDPKAVLPSADILRSYMLETDSQRLRLICAQTLATADHQESAADLLKLAENASDPFRLAVEPALIRWNYSPAEAMWTQRLQDAQATNSAIRLACEGLAALDAKSALPQLTGLLDARQLSFAKRRAAAAAIAALDPAAGRSSATGYRDGTVADRLLAVSLLSCPASESLQQLTEFTGDAATGVAAAAWHALETLDPQRLTDQLETGRHHQDARIRMVAARVMRQFPSADRCVWLAELLNDQNIEVRNEARQSLVAVADGQPELRAGIRQAAEARIRENLQQWQGLEQSLVLLGQLLADGNSEACMALMSHERPEVRVTAAWVLHLFPDEEVLEPALDWLHRCEAAMEASVRGEDISATGISMDSAHFQMASIIQLAGLLRARSEQSYLEKNFNMMAVGGEAKRSAAMWALGLLNEGSGNAALARQYAGRIGMRYTMPSEAETVRQKSVLGLGMIKSVDSADVIEEAYQLDPPKTLIPHAARWAMSQIGKPALPPVPREEASIGGWKLNPAIPATPPAAETPAAAP